jgi:hypothetical protein
MVNGEWRMANGEREMATGTPFAICHSLFAGFRHFVNRQQDVCRDFAHGLEASPVE